jgi:hypothetical protein
MEDRAFRMAADIIRPVTAAHSSAAPDLRIEVALTGISELETSTVLTNRSKTFRWICAEGNLYVASDALFRARCNSRPSGYC